LPADPPEWADVGYPAPGPVAPMPQSESPSRGRCGWAAATPTKRFNDWVHNARFRLTPSQLAKMGGEGAPVCPGWVSKMFDGHCHQLFDVSNGGPDQRLVRPLVNTLRTEHQDGQALGGGGVYSYLSTAGDCSRGRIHQATIHWSASGWSCATGAANHRLGQRDSVPYLALSPVARRRAGLDCGGVHVVRGPRGRGQGAEW
jgi:hypothetical protein